MEELFTASRLEVLVPEERVRLDSLDTTSPTWWSQLSTKPQRKLAFFGELFSMVVPILIRLTV